MTNNSYNSDHMWAVNKVARLIDALLLSAATTFERHAAELHAARDE